MLRQGSGAVKSNGQARHRTSRRFIALIIAGIVFVFLVSLGALPGMSTMGLLSVVLNWTGMTPRRCGSRYRCSPLSEQQAADMRSVDVRTEYDHTLFERRPPHRTALLAITTCNQWRITEAMLQHFLDSYDRPSRSRPFDIVIIDDVSEDGTPAMARAAFNASVAAAAGLTGAAADRGRPPVLVVEKDRPRGLTHSWNLAYQIFKREGYETFFVVNNDLIVPPGALERMVAALEDDDAAADEVGPLYHREGLGHGAKASNYPYQNVEVARPDAVTSELLADLPVSADEIQRRLELPAGSAAAAAAAAGSAKPGEERLTWRPGGGGSIAKATAGDDPATDGGRRRLWASIWGRGWRRLEALATPSRVEPAPHGLMGSFLGFHRRVIPKEIRPNHLFCPELMNLGQEEELRCRDGSGRIRSIVCTDAFVFHSKGATLGGYGNTHRNDIMECHQPPPAPDFADKGSGAVEAAAATHDGSQRHQRRRRTLRV